ncbi:hypothetical protein SAMN05192529_10310 [Arachidicoccus rhizosphaerae]|uniref:Tetratricopeptide repeat-containing protein n=1 Tax=Arachidicoccus rhizosphaerae TaxID=551991 RepID=A0A1H3WGE4_9BACT|nr:hypothetical protein [Arachidicoccus rhizosphaerae]SDZ86219.1 hypothetical protein SAMN05192529_10310 [Arachidicoccus rhizosphaerae]
MRSRNSRRPTKGSHFNRPDLWQTASSEEIIRLLIALDFNATEIAFNNWNSNNPIETPEELQKKEPAVYAARKAALDWAPKLEGWNNTGKQLTVIDQEKLQQLLQDFKDYEFGKWLSNFSQSLLQLLYRLSQDLIKSCIKKEVPDEENPLTSSSSTSSKEGPYAPYLHEQCGIYHLVDGITSILQRQKINPRAKIQTVDLLKEARKAFPQDGRLSYLLAGSYFENNQNKDARQQYAKSLLYFPELAESMIIQNPTIEAPNEIKKLIGSQAPARAVAIGFLQGIFQLIELPVDFSINDAMQQKALLSYLALYDVEQATLSAPTDLIYIAKCRKHLKETDLQLYNKYMAIIRAREER